MFVQLFSAALASIYIAGAQALAQAPIEPPAGVRPQGTQPLEPQGNCARTYTVQPGDTCDLISAAQGVSTFQLASANPQVDPQCSNIFEGDTLCLALAGQDCQPTHVVEEGDICNDIAADAGITFDQLRANNPNIDENCLNIYLGEVLCVGSVAA